MLTRKRERAKLFAGSRYRVSLFVSGTAALGLVDFADPGFTLVRSVGSARGDADRG